MEGIIIEGILDSSNERVEIDIEKLIFNEIVKYDILKCEKELIKAFIVLLRSHFIKRVKSSKYYYPQAENSINLDAYKSLKDDHLKILQECAKETRGIITLNNNKAVDLYCTKSCGGATANSEDISAIRVNYLRKVICKNCSEVISEKIIPLSKFAEKLKISARSCKDELGSVFKDVIRDSSGRIISLKFFGRNMTGEEFVSFFDIGSNKAYFIEDSVILKTVGEGLGLGVCIDGANNLALKGYSYRDIIKFYYTDVEIVSINEEKLSRFLEDKRFIIDPGHGGEDKGNQFNEIMEKDANLNISKELKKNLAAIGAQVLMTRDDDFDITLGERVEIINSNRPDFYLSIHQNSFISHSVNGIEIYSYNNDEEAIKLGEYIMKEISDRINIKKRGVRTGDYYLLRECKISGIIIECMYITGDSDSLKYNSEMYKKIAYAIFEGICKYYNVKP